jgi:hypothetical protein
MMGMLNQVNQDELAECMYFSTLTYPGEFARDRATWRSHIRAFFKRLRRRFDIQAIVWKLEPQRRLAPHYHMMIFSHDEITNEAIAGMWHDIAGGEDPTHLAWHLGELGGKNKPCTSRINFYDGVKSYCSKYCSKEIEGDTLPGWWRGGRFWGVIGELPITLQTVDVSPREAFDMRRWMRRLYKAKTGRKFTTRGVQGITSFCDNGIASRMLTYAAQREQQRDQDQPSLDHYRIKAARGMRYQVDPFQAKTIDMAQAERDYRDRLYNYGREEVQPEDCRTVLEKYGFVGLEERTRARLEAGR